MAKKPFKKTAPAKKSPVKELQKKHQQPTKKAYEQKPLHGALFKNDQKESESHPDYKGSYTDENGNKFWVAAWVNVSAAGNKYLSLTMQSAEVSTEEEEEEEEEDGL